MGWLRTRMSFAIYSPGNYSMSEGFKIESVAFRYGRKCSTF